MLAHALALPTAARRVCDGLSAEAARRVTSTESALAPQQLHRRPRADAARSSPCRSGPTREEILLAAIFGSSTCARPSSTTSAPTQPQRDAAPSLPLPPPRRIPDSLAGDAARSGRLRARAELLAQAVGRQELFGDASPADCLSMLTAAFICWIAWIVSSALTLLSVSANAGPSAAEHALLHDRRDVLEAEHVLRVGQHLELAARAAARRCVNTFCTSTCPLSSAL